MQTLDSISARSPVMHDLDGFSVPTDYSYPLQNHFASGDDFGFDPPVQPGGYSKAEAYSPPSQLDPLQLSSWPGFELPENHKHAASLGPELQTYELDRLIAQNLPVNATANVRFGQLSPPRSNSASSEDQLKTGSSAPKLATRKRSAKNVSKHELSAPKTTSDPPSTSQASGRKRKQSRKPAAAAISAGEEQDDKRRQSLEKNRLAAAKCRINKKEKTEQLQRDSHDKAVHNAFLKEQIMRMKDEVQQMNAILLAHANCDGCKSPEEIQQHLSNLGQEYLANHMSPSSFADYASMDLSDNPDGDLLQPDYFSHAAGTADLLNPALPEFEPRAEFDADTSMQTD